MSDSQKNFEWHLTPSGWVRGSTDPPDNRVLTMLCQETEAHIDCREVWSSPSKDEIKLLIEKYGHSPKR